jgi:hypothetical protein
MSFAYYGAVFVFFGAVAFGILVAAYSAGRSTRIAVRREGS